MVHECPYCSEEEPEELELIEIDIGTGERRYMCPECGYEMWE